MQISFKCILCHDTGIVRCPVCWGNTEFEDQTGADHWLKPTPLLSYCGDSDCSYEAPQKRACPACTNGQIGTDAMLARAAEDQQNFASSAMAEYWRLLADAYRPKEEVDVL